MKALRKFLERVFDIRSGEWDRLLLLYAFAFMLNVSVIWGKASSESLFLKQVGVEILPLMFVADAILNIITLVIYTAFADRMPNNRLMVLILLGGAAVLIAARVGIALALNPIYLILYLAGRVIQVIVSIHAWTFIADFYDTRTAKRHFPLIASASRTSGVIAGLLILPIVSLFNTSNLVIAWALALVAAAFLTWYTPRNTPPVNTYTPQSKEEHRSFAENIGDGFKFVSASTFLKLMGAAAFLSTLLLYLLDFQSQVFFDNYFETADDLAAFYGVLGAVVDAIALPFQMFILSRIVTKLGVGTANLVFPGISALSYALLINPTLASASLARSNHTALRSAFRTPIDSLLYNAVPVSIKGRARAFNGLLIPLGTLIAGLMLIALPVGTTLITIGITVALLYVYVAYRIRREYARSLTSLLAEDELNIFRLGDMGSDQPKDVTVKLIKERIDTTEDEALLVFLSEMIYDLQGRASIPYLYDIANRHGARLRAGVIEQIGIYWQGDQRVRDLLLAGVEADEAELRLASLRALVGTGQTEVTHDEELLDLFLRMLDDQDEKIQSMVVPALIASGDFYYLSPGVQTLSKWLSTEASSRERTLGLRVLANTGSDRMVRTMIRYLQDPEPMVRRQAAALIDNMVAHTLDPEMQTLGLQTLASLLDDDDETVRLTAVQSLGNFDHPDAGKALIVSLADRSFAVRRQASRLVSERIGEELETALDDENQYMAESVAYILSVNKHARARRRAIELMDRLVGDTYALMAQRIPLQVIDTPAVNLLRETLQDQEELLMERFFWLLGALSTEDEARHIQLALQEPDGLKQANALEALESLSTPALAVRVAPLYTGKDVTNQLEKWRTSLNLALLTKWQAFFQVWPRLRDASRTTLTSRKLFLPDDDGWLTATAMMAIVEMEKQGLIDDPDSPIDHAAVRLALEASTRDEVPLVSETAEIALQRLLSKADNPMEGAMLSTIEKVIFLKEVPFFADMTIAQLRVLANISEEKSFNEGQVIFEEGDYGDALYVVISGEVALQKRQVSASGRQTNIRRLTQHGSREYFAEMNIFDDKPQQYDAVAIQETRLLAIRRETLVALINYQPDLSLTLLRVLSERLRQYSDVIADKSEARPEQLVNLFDRLS